MQGKKLALSAPVTTFRPIFTLCVFPFAIAYTNIASLPYSLPRFDEAQLRFKKGSKLDENFYVRQDGTCSFFFSEEELRSLAQEVGFHCEELQTIQRQYANRQQRKARSRAWIHMKLCKPKE